MNHCPIHLLKRMGDGPGGERRYQLEVPEGYDEQALELDRHRGEMFVMVGPIEDIGDYERIAGK